MKKIFVTAAALTLTLGASAQGNNTGMGGDHEGCTSLAERVLKLEKKNDASTFTSTTQPVFRRQTTARSGVRPLRTARRAWSLWAI